MARPTRAKQILVTVLTVVVALVVWWWEQRTPTSTSPTTRPNTPRAPGRSPRTTPPPAREDLSQGEKAVLEAFRARRSDVWVSVEGEIVHLLRDDLVGSRHQLFLLELASGHTLKISHNIDLAPRVPVRKGDRVTVRGEYEWNDKGGVVHWTHHDPRGRRAGGWIRHAGKTYK